MTTKKTLLDIVQEGLEERQSRPYWTYVGRTTKTTLLDICWKDYKEDLIGHMLEGQQRRPYGTYVGRTTKMTLLDICWKDQRRPYWTYVGRTTKKTLLDICWKDDKGHMSRNFVRPSIGHMLEGLQRTTYVGRPYWTGTWTHVGRTIDLTGHMLEERQRTTYVGRTHVTEDIC